LSLNLINKKNWSE